MPVLTIDINRPLEQDRCSALLNQAVDMLSVMLDKPKGSILVSIRPDSQLVLGNTNEPAAWIELKLFDFQDNAAEYVKQLTEFVHKELGVAPDRQFQEFTVMQPSMFGWNGSTC